MKQFILLFLALALSCNLMLGQNAEIDEIKTAINEAETASEKLLLRYELAEAYLKVDADQAVANGKQAYDAAVAQGNKSMAARSAYLVALAYERLRDDRNTEVWLRTTTNYAKQVEDADLIIRSVDKRSRLAEKDRNYRRAYEINQEAFTYFSENGRSMSELQADYERRKQQLERERGGLQRERDQLEFQVRNLRLQAEQLGMDKSELEKQTERLNQDYRSKTEELSSKTEELESVSKEKAQVEARAKSKEKEVEALSEEAAKQQLVIESTRAELAEAELETERQRTLIYAAIGAVMAVMLLSLLLYSRFRAKRRAAKVLEEKNRQIEMERARSEELLLNILPASIAEELKQHGKAQARQFGETSVMFSDFKNFTHIAEQLSPEELVEELDTCFKAFDDILKKYPDIEKIKTIGDAYMCASGLDTRKTLPRNLVSAALEIQQFLDTQKQERQRLGKPFFEARIGIHTGPVVAGVVGSRKFAYDIWGDTVNTAARVESQSFPGKVNISETTYRLIRYDFDCTYRGKVEAKNKGELDMYFVDRPKLQ